MSEVIYKVLQDTRNDINPDVCAKCQSPVRPVYASTTNRYHICVYECKKCGNMSFALYEIFDAEAQLDSDFFFPTYFYLRDNAQQKKNTSATLGNLRKTNHLCMIYNKAPR